MQLPLPQTIDRAMWLRYLGAGGWTPDEATAALLEKAERAVWETATPRGVWRALPFAALPLETAGTDLARHLQGCDRMVLMAATLGGEIDALVRRLEVSDIALGAAVDAAASVLLESVCDALETTIRAEITAQGAYLTGRYSPGYGNCPLELQDELCLALDTVRGMGLAVTPQHLMTPRKSVTAILGVAAHPVTGARAGCAHCLLRETCAYRKRGKTCED